MLKEIRNSGEISNRMFLRIPTAASLAGFSIRHFRRIIEDDSIPTMRIGRKFFIVASDFQNWQATKGTTRSS
jgi:excisionase family DNA binding protein